MWRKLLSDMTWCISDMTWYLSDMTWHLDDITWYSSDMIWYLLSFCLTYACWAPNKNSAVRSSGECNTCVMIFFDIITTKNNHVVTIYEQILKSFFLFSLTPAVIITCHRPNISLCAFTGCRTHSVVESRLTTQITELTKKCSYIDIWLQILRTVEPTEDLWVSIFHKVISDK